MDRTYEQEVPRLRRIGIGFALGGVVLFGIGPMLQVWLAIAALVVVTGGSFLIERQLSAATYVSQGLGIAVVVVVAGTAMGVEFPILELAALCFVAGALQALAAPFLATVRTIDP